MGAMTSLNLSSNSLGGSKFARAGLRPLAAALKANTTIQELNVSNNRFFSKDVPMLADAISNMGALSSANLLKNDISTNQARALVSILKKHATLKSLCGNKGNETELDMSGKMGGAADAIMLVPEIIDNGAILSLDISNNSICTKIIGPKKADTEGLEGDTVEFNGGVGVLASWNDTYFGFLPLSGMQALTSAIKDNGALSCLTGDDRFEAKKKFFKATSICKHCGQHKDQHSRKV